MALRNQDWFRLKKPSDVISPSLLVYPERIRHNIRTMISIAGDASRLRPHIKTHKMAEIIRQQMDHGINKFKCATIAEAELLGHCGVDDVLLAMQPVGANIRRFGKLIAKYPKTSFATIIDNPDSLKVIGELAEEMSQPVPLFLDINSGMNRTGIPPGEDAFKIYEQMDHIKGIIPMGLHVYDGHIRHPDPGKRKKDCDAAFELVKTFKDQLTASGLKVPVLVAGGSPTFPIHAQREGVELSPGTTLLWDARYGELCRDLDFLPAAVLFSRVVSKPTPEIICTDLGHKAVAPEMSFPRVQFLNLPNSTQVAQSEEHLVISTRRAGEIPIGRETYSIPMHICPTVAKYPFVLTVEEGLITGKWKVAARDYKIDL